MAAGVSDRRPSAGEEPFASQLRRLRLSAALTQERLAERAGISPTGVAALEAGRRRSPRLTTVTLLADALELGQDDRASLIAAASRPAPRSGAGGERVAGPVEREEGRETHRPAPFAPVGGWRHPFVGRSGQMERLETAWSARRRMVLVSGEAGIGKTRLTDRFAELVRDRGAGLLAGRWTAESLGAFAGFVGPLRQAADQVDLATLEGAGELLRLAPELASRLEEGVAPTQADSGVERRLLFEAVGDLLGRLGPTLLILDDLHWADVASLALLTHLAGDRTLSDLVVLGTVRSNDLSPATAGALAELGRVCDVERVTLTALEPTELARLVGHIAGGSAPEDLVEAVATSSEGNTFFAEELTEHLLNLRAETLAYQDQGGISLPDRIRDMVGRRVAGLSADAQTLLRVGAILGREFDPRLAGSLGGLDETAAIAAGEDALLSGLVTESSASQLAFSHALVQTAVEADLSSLRRVDINRRAAVALADSEPDQPEGIARVARHWAVVAELDRSAATSAASWSVRAGDAALAAAATEEAIARYETATDMWARATVEHADTLIRLGTALHSCGRVVEADRRFWEAFHLARALADDVLLGRAALGLAKTLDFGRVDQDRIDALETAFARLPADDPVLRPTIAAMLVRQLTFDRSDSSSERREEMAEEVAKVADRPGVPSELLMSLAGALDYVALSDPDPLDRLSRQMVADAGSRRDLFALANAWWAQAWSALERAHHDDWVAAVSSYEVVAQELELPAQLGMAASLRSAAAQIQGRFDTAREFSDQAVASLQAGGDGSAMAVHLGRAALISLDTGEAGQMLPFMTELAGEFERVETFQAGLAVISAIAGDLDLAGRLLDQRARTGFHRLRRDLERLGSLAFYAHTAAILGSAAHAPALYELLSDVPASGVRVGAIVGWWGPVDHHLGALSRVLGRPEQARTHLERALHIERAMRAEPFLARTRGELEAVLGGEGGPGR